MRAAVADISMIPDILKKVGQFKEVQQDALEGWKLTVLTELLNCSNPEEVANPKLEVNKLIPTGMEKISK